MSNFNAHVRGDRVKWFITVIAFLLVGVLICGLMTSWFKDFNPYCWFGHDYDENGICTKCGEEEPEEVTDEEETPTVAAVRYLFASLGEDVPSSSIALMSSVMPMATSKVSWSMSSDQSTATFTAVDPFVWSIKFGGFSRIYDDTQSGQPVDSTFTVKVADLIKAGQIEYNVSYPITYDYNPGAWQNIMGNNVWMATGAMETGTLGNFKVQTVSELPPAPTKTGYTFTGWYTDEACTKPYTDDKVIGDITLYAGFRANTYSVKFNANGGSGSMSNQSMTYDQSKALTANAFSKTGYTFKGWATSSSGSVAYSNSQSVKNLSATQGATVNLYAVWGANTYTITFNANGGTGSMSNQSMTYDKAANLTSNAFTRKNHEFKGWATSAGGDVVYINGQSVNNLTATSGGNVNLYAVWELVTYNVSFSVDGQITSTIEVEKETAATLPEEPSKEGYNFVGWTLPSGEIYTNQAITADTVLTAKFEIIKCVVTFIVDGEVYAYYECDWGTQLKDMLETNVNTLLYAPEGEYSENF